MEVNSILLLGGRVVTINNGDKIYCSINNCIYLILHKYSFPKIPILMYRHLAAFLGCEFEEICVVYMLL